MTVRHWKSVEDNNQEKWSEAERKVFEGKLDEVGLCPSCGKAPLKYYFDRNPQPRAFPRGGFWIWCNVCFRFEHTSCHVPDWWADPPQVQKDKLEHNPEWIEEHWEELDISVLHNKN